MVAQIYAIQCVTEPLCLPSYSSESLPMHLHDVSGQHTATSIGGRPASIFRFIPRTRFNTYRSYRRGGTRDRSRRWVANTLYTQPDVASKDEKIRGVCC